MTLDVSSHRVGTVSFHQHNCGPEKPGKREFDVITQTERSSLSNTTWGFKYQFCR